MDKTKLINEAEKYINSCGDGETNQSRLITQFCAERNLDENTEEEIQTYFFTKGALSNGIPLQVILGQKKLKDYFSEEYIKFRKFPTP